MKKEDIAKAVQKLQSTLVKKNFKQTVELILNLRDMDLKQNEQQVDIYVELPHPHGREVKVCALAGPEMSEQAKSACDRAITQDEFITFQGDKKKIRKLAREYDFFIAQANIMPEIAKVFGRVFGPKKKMPDPKAGCVVPPNANLPALVQRLKKLVRVTAKTQPSIKTIVGKEDTPEQEIIDNCTAVISALVHKLPQEEKNIRNALLKTSMGPIIKVGEVTA